MTEKEAIQWFKAKLAVNEAMGFQGNQNETAHMAIAALADVAVYRATNLTPERCAELAKAEREGRLVVLPEGTTRDIAEWMHGLFEKWNPIIAQYAAEAALEGRRDS